MESEHSTPSRRGIYDGGLSNTLERPFIPHQPLDLPLHPPLRTLQEFRDSEGRANRKCRLQELWKRLPKPPPSDHETLVNHATNKEGLSYKKAEMLRSIYDNELMCHCGVHTSSSHPRHIGWKAFKEYAEAKEVGEFSLPHPWLILLNPCRLKNYGPFFTTSLTWTAMGSWMYRNLH